MHFLLLCILSSFGIFLIFKFLDQNHIPPLPVIVINYLVASILGFMIGSSRHTLLDVAASGWLPVAGVIGFLFIMMFFLLSWSSRKAGLSVTTVAAKMSVVFPILFSIIIDKGDRLTPYKAIAILIALAGVALTVLRPGGMKREKGAMWIPLLLFAGMGLADSLVKYAQQNHVKDTDTALFGGVLFLVALITGAMILLFDPPGRKACRSLPVWTWGIALGAVNFGSVYFLIKTRNYGSPSGGGFDSSVVFGVNNTAIVALSVLTGTVLFSERPKPVNWTGIFLSVAAILLFSREL
jgi:drug/metabolite transporter (DMT)-like permease